MFHSFRQKNLNSNFHSFLSFKVIFKILPRLSPIQDRGCARCFATATAVLTYYNISVAAAGNWPQSAIATAGHQQPPQGWAGLTTDEPIFHLRCCSLGVDGGRRRRRLCIICWIGWLPEMLLNFCINFCISKKLGQIQYCDIKRVK
jgi:hypothetical protein